MENIKRCCYNKVGVQIYMKVHNGSYKLVGNENYTYLVNSIRWPMGRFTSSIKNAVKLSDIG